MSLPLQGSGLVQQSEKEYMIIAAVPIHGLPMGPRPAMAVCEGVKNSGEAPPEVAVDTATGGAVK